MERQMVRDWADVVSLPKTWFLEVELRVDEVIKVEKQVLWWA